MPEIRRLNFTEPAAKLDIDPADIPTLVPAAVLGDWLSGDTNPYYKIQKIEYPVKANGLLYVESFFQSFVDKLKKRPIPGAKGGHEMFYGKRAPTDFILVGGKIEKSGGGKGFIYLKNYIPPEGASGDNAIFIRENQSGMVHYSIVTYPREEIEAQPDGERLYKIVESMYGERNDAVEYGTGAMKQELNAASMKLIKSSVSNARKLIKAGKIDGSSKWSFSGDDGNSMLGESGDDWTEYKKWHMAENTSTEEETKARYKYPYGKNGKVYRSALRAIASRAAQQDFEELSDLASSLLDEIDSREASGAGKSKSRGEASMEKEELLRKLNAMKANAEITLAEVAAAMGLSDQLVTDEHRKAVNILVELGKIKVADPVIEINALRQKLDSGADAVRNAELDSAFGPEADGKNLLRHYAGEKIGKANGEELKTAIKALKESDPVAKDLAARNADYTTGGKPAIVEDGQKPAVTGKRRVDKV